MKKELNTHFLTIIVNNKSIYHYYVRDITDTDNVIIGISSYENKKGWYLNRTEGSNYFVVTELNTNTQTLNLTWKEFNKTFGYKSFLGKVELKKIPIVVQNLIPYIEVLRWDIITKSLDC